MMEVGPFCNLCVWQIVFFPNSGEGCSSISGGDMIVPMDVDEAPASTQPADSILSPPASNETPEQGNHHWNRVGTPSVGENTNYTVMMMMMGEGMKKTINCNALQAWQPRLAQADAHSMNQIYPTPPSVQSEAQQFSPASVPPPQQTVAHMPPCSQLYQVIASWFLVKAVHLSSNLYDCIQGIGVEKDRLCVGLKLMSSMCRVFSREKKKVETNLYRAPLLLFLFC